METWDAVTARRNVREFTDDAISESDWNRILEAAWRSPSSRNSQPWDFVAVTDPAMLEEISKVWVGGGHIAGAKGAVVILIDAGGEPRERESHSYDIGQASLQMMVTAADLGIGSGHSAVGDQDLARKLLGFPETKMAKYIIDFGHPADRPLKPIQKPARRPYEEVVHQGHW